MNQQPINESARTVGAVQAVEQEEHHGENRDERAEL
jgi:hypothetical protein